MTILNSESTNCEICDAPSDGAQYCRKHALEIMSQLIEQRNDLYTQLNAAEEARPLLEAMRVAYEKATAEGKTRDEINELLRHLSENWNSDDQAQG